MNVEIQAYVDVQLFRTSELSMLVCLDAVKDSMQRDWSFLLLTGVLYMQVSSIGKSAVWQGN